MEGGCVWEAREVWREGVCGKCGGHKCAEGGERATKGRYEGWALPDRTHHKDRINIRIHDLPHERRLVEQPAHRATKLLFGHLAITVRVHVGKGVDHPHACTGEGVEDGGAHLWEGVGRRGKAWEGAGRREKEA